VRAGPADDRTLGLAHIAGFIDDEPESITSTSTFTAGSP